MSQPVRPPDIGSRPSIGQCHENVPSAGSEKQSKTIVIAPIRFKQSIEEDGSFISLIAFSCNFSKACYSATCLYAKGGRVRDERM
jgi:hypothetical protein